MSFLAILELILSLAPSGIALTKDILAIIQELEGVLGQVPPPHQTAVATVTAKALLADAKINQS